MNDLLILASKSPRRKQLLELAEIGFEIFIKDTDESYPAELPISEVPVFIAMQKARDIHSDFPDRKILAADTIVVLGKQIIGKPKDRADAIQILTRLSGKTHTVITGVVMLDREKVIQFSDTTEVEFHPIPLKDIEYYVDVYNPYDKAGAYAIQEWIGAIAIKRINGCFYNVMGLPVSKVVQCLAEVIN
ncbi:maf-like protein CHU_1308 [Filimonas sp.]|nr:maf-like protein CHU_1308 [Filimonas sp.]